jgi:lysyl endopeptidase
MNYSLKLFLAVTALSILTACGNSSSGTDPATTAVNKSTDLSAIGAAAAGIALASQVDAYRPTPTPATQESPVKAIDQSAAPVATNVALGAPLPSQTTAAQKYNQSSAATEGNMGKPLQIGFGRDVAQTATVLATKQLLSWKTTASGSQVAAINFNSTGAKGMRVGLLVTQLPETATLRFYAKGAATAFEVKGAVVLKTLAANAASGDKSDEGRTYWGPVIDGADATIEIEMPTGTSTSDVNVSVPSVSHMFMTSREASTYSSQATYTGDANRSLACQVDVTCTTPLPASSDATAYLVFNKNGLSYSCSGTLLNDNINSSTPYLLTANHCISSQSVAATLYTEFKYRSTTCNDGTTGSYFNTLTTGSTLLYTAYNTDTTLVRLAATPGGGTSVLYAGWDATTIPATTTVIHSTHHPKSDQQRLSRGTVLSYAVRDTVNPNSFYSSILNPSVTSINSDILEVRLTNGLTESGSSGSGLFKGTDANPIVIGQLFGGTAPACGVNSNNVYGRFDVAFNAGMKDWLVQGAKFVSQLYNASSGIHYYTYGQTDINTFSTSNPAYGNQGEVFKVSSYQTAGLSPVYRFYNTSNGTYFYTISEKERAAVASNTPRMRYDGVVWYATAASTASTVPVYSAFNKVTGSQHFTTNSATRASLIAANPQFITDGIAFYVTP